jgi:hypothetical protein
LCERIKRFFERVPLDTSKPVKSEAAKIGLSFDAQLAVDVSVFKESVIVIGAGAVKIATVKTKRTLLRITSEQMRCSSGETAFARHTADAIHLKAVLVSQRHGNRTFAEAKLLVSIATNTKSYRDIWCCNRAIISELRARAIHSRLNGLILESNLVLSDRLIDCGQLLAKPCSFRQGLLKPIGHPLLVSL